MSQRLTDAVRVQTVFALSMTTAESPAQRSIAIRIG
jgi:hypothetical protein